MLSLMLVTGLSSNATAAPIPLDNDVSVEWGNFRCFPAYNLFACPQEIPITGGIRLVTAAERNDLAVTVDFNTSDNEIERFQLFLHVGDLSQQELLVLSTDELSNIVDWTFLLPDFVNGGTLPAGATLTFSLTARFFGNSGFGQCKDDAFFSGDPLDIILLPDGTRVPERVCGVASDVSTFLPATINLTGGTEVPQLPQQVPEPGTLFLLIGGIGCASLRRFRPSRARQS
jgi:hypothetical protein